MSPILVILVRDANVIVDAETKVNLRMCWLDCQMTTFVAGSVDKRRPKVHPNDYYRGIRPLADFTNKESLAGVLN